MTESGLKGYKYIPVIKDMSDNPLNGIKSSMPSDLSVDFFFFVIEIFEKSSDFFHVTARLRKLRKMLSRL